VTYPKLAALCLLALTCGAHASTTMEVSVGQALAKATELASDGRTAEANAIWEHVAEQSGDVLAVLEAGRAQMKAGLPKEALQSFKRARTFSLPAAMSAKLRVLEERANRQLGQWLYSWSVSRHKNPMNYPDSGTYTVLGYPLRYENRYGGSYYAVNQQIGYVREVSDVTDIEITLNSTEFEGGFADKNSTRLRLNRQLPASKSVISPSVSYSDQPGYVEMQVGVGLTSFANRLMQPSLELKRVMRKNEPLFNGNEMVLSATFSSQITNLDLRTTARYGRVDLKSDQQSNTNIGASISAHRAFASLDFSSTLDHTRKSFDKADFLWGERRRERITSFAISLCYKAIPPFGSAYCVDLGRTIGNANIDFYDYAKTELNFRLSN